MKKLYFFITLTSFLYFSSALSSDPRSLQGNYTFLQVKDTKQIRKMRTTLEHDPVDKCLKANKKLTIARMADEDESRNRCDYFALKKAIGITDNTDFAVDNSRFNRRVEGVEKYYQQTNKPKPNDIVLYVQSPQNPEATHFAVVESVEKKRSWGLPKKKHLVLQSKWGAEKEIMQHRLFDVPSQYGSAAVIFTPKDEYKNRA